MAKEEAKVISVTAFGKLSISLMSDGAVVITGRWNDGDESTTFETNENGSWYRIKSV